MTLVNKLSSFHIEVGFQPHGFNDYFWSLSADLEHLPTNNEVKDIGGQSACEKFHCCFSIFSVLKSLAKQYSPLILVVFPSPLFPFAFSNQPVHSRVPTH